MRCVGALLWCTPHVKTRRALYRRLKSVPRVCRRGGGRRQWPVGGVWGQHEREAAERCEELVARVDEVQPGARLTGRTDGWTDGRTVRRGRTAHWGRHHGQVVRTVIGCMRNTKRSCDAETVVLIM